VGYYGKSYWLSKGCPEDVAELRAQGLDRCCICASVIERKSSLITGRVICSDKCLTISKHIAMDKYKQTCRNRSRCKICGKSMSKKESVHQKHYICSPECNSIRRSMAPKRLSVLNTEYWLEKGLTVEQANQHVSSTQRIRSPASIEHWTNLGYSLDQSRALVHEHQKAVSAKGAAKPLDHHRLHSHRCVEYWINKGLSPLDAREAVRNVATMNSLAGFIHRHGDEEGARRHKDYCNLKRIQNNVTYFIEKYGEQEGLEIWLRRFVRNRSASQFATNLFTNALAKSSLGVQKLDCYFQTDSKKEFGVRRPDGCYLYDFVIPALKLCIELHGAFWHGDPEKYKSGDVITLKDNVILVDDLWKRDTDKRKVMEDRGFRYVELWYRKSREYDMLLKACLDVIAEQYLLYGSKYEKTTHRTEVI
jgi:G:T-mismatch repair DNA endonuclease (very short patch repair protein)